MGVKYCTNCNTVLPGTASYCAICGENLTPLHRSRPLSATDEQRRVPDTPADSPEHFDHLDHADRPIALKVPRFYGLGTEESGISNRDTPPTGTKTIPLRSLSGSLSNGSASSTTLRSPTLQDEIDLDELWDWDEMEMDGLGGINGINGTNGGNGLNGNGRRSRTWQKVVSSEIPGIPLTPRTPRPATITPPSRPAVVKPAPRPALVNRVPLKAGARRPSFNIVRSLPFLVIIMLVIGTVVGGVVGAVTSLGHSVLGQAEANHGEPLLQVSPPDVALGGMITLRGANFSPNGKVGLTRDANIPIFDLDGKSIIQADGRGAFVDKVSIDVDWQAGSHTIHAEDALLHKLTGFSILVMGVSPSLRPAHLSLLQNGQPLRVLDLGSGDQATNSTQGITLTNSGGGQISWQALVTQPWLLVAPKGGTFSSGQNANVTVAVDRSNLKVGDYTASIIFSSNAGQVSLSAKMKVTPLEPGHQAVLQLTPAVLSFTATDGGADPPGQVVTVSNPGVLSLNWSASVSAGTNWLSISPQSGTVRQAESAAVTVNVAVSTLLPGTYTGFVTFTTSGSNAVKNSPQSVFVTVTITPQCTLLVSPGGLSFTGVYLQPAPAPKVISLTVPQGCAAHLQWSASTQTKWLKVGTGSGVTPSNLAISVSTTGLTPGTYTGSALFNSSSGTLTLPVSLTIGQPTTPILSTGAAGLNFSTVAGQANPGGQAVTITNTGGGNLAWTATPATSVGGAWLTVNPTSGGLSAKQSVSLNVSATLLTGLTPGTYTGTITIAGTDGAGNAATGSPQSIAVTFVVQSACTVAATPVALSFAGVVGQPNPARQSAKITATGTCSHTLNWAATVATTPAGGTWLTATPSSGTVALTKSSTTSVGVVLTGLTAGTYTGSVTITATDKVTGLAVGTAQSVTVTLTVQPPCTLQAPSVTAETFTAEVGSNPNPASQTFKIGVTGGCAGKAPIKPTVTLGSGTGWLAVTPANAKIGSGKNATFTVTVTSASLPIGTYTGSISLAAVNRGIAITGSSQTVSVTLNVLAPPTLLVSPASLTFNVTTGISSQPLTISNSGGEPLNWTAALAANAPAFVSLSASSGNGVAGGGGSTTFNVIVNATGVPGGSTFTTSVTVGATDPITGNAAAGSPLTASITINVASPAMQLDTAALSFTTTIGTNPAAQSINIINAGGDTLSWTASTPDQSWLTVSQTSGSDTADQVSQVTFTVDVTGMTSGTYTATVTITAAGGTTQTVAVTLTIN